MSNLYKDLDVESTASQDEIKKSYRNKANVHHPDKGGDPSSFRKINEAYKILSNQTLREKYDNGESPESINSPNNRHSLIMNTLRNIFVEIVSSTDPVYTNIVNKMAGSIKNSQVSAKDQIKACNGQIGKYEKIKNRLKCSDESDNFFYGVIDNKIKGFNSQLSNLEDQYKLGDEMLEVLSKYTYETDKKNMTFSNEVTGGYTITTPWGGL